MGVCNKCERFGLRFDRGYEPSDFVEGDPNADVWIIGLNPAGEPKWTSTTELKSALDDERTRHPYFRDFAKISNKIKLHSAGNTAHTDLVKCPSRAWPKGIRAHQIIDNCRPYLEQQLKRHAPKVIVCNGAPVSKGIQEVLIPSRPLGASATQYESEIEGRLVIVILSGFVGRIDDFAKRRLGREIDAALDAHSRFSRQIT